MAEKDAERKVRIYRSVSFKKLGNWNAKAFSEEGGTDLPGKGDVTQPTCQKTHRPPARSLSLTRKVSKISAASKDQNISSVRQISQRFSSHPRDDGAQSDDESLRRADLLRKACQPRSREAVSPVETLHGEQLKQGTTDYDGISLALPGKSDDYLDPRESQSSGISVDEVNSFCSFLHQTDNRELLVAEGSNWPSVTEMRKLFGESTRKLPSRASSLPESEEPRPHGQSGPLVKETAVTEPQRHCSLEVTSSKNLNHYTKDNPSSTLHRSTNPSTRTESSYCRELTESRTEQQTVCMDTKDHRVINTGSKPQPPPPPPRTCIPFGLRANTLSSGLPKQEARQQSDSLHSYHSSGKPQLAPSNVRLKDSSSEDELHKNTLSRHIPGDSSDAKDRPKEVSSGSEEDSDKDVIRDSFRKRSIRKKKRGIAAYPTPNKESESSRGHLVGDLGHGTGLSAFSQQRHDSLSILSNNSSNTVLKSDICPTEQNVLGVSSGAFNETSTQRIRSISETLTPTTPGQLATVSPIPIVSRVAKVNIPPFLPSPCGSRSSSRYSSTETLKDDDHFSPFFSSQARSFQGSSGIYRSPSYGQHESMSRQLMRPRSKVPCSISKVKDENVSDSSNCDPQNNSSGNMKSMSNPDITSDTLCLLNFLKSDILDLKLKNRGQGTSDKEGSYAKHESYQGTAGPQNPLAKGTSVGQERLQQGSRPSLKDLTATLRRTKSFTYSDKLGSRRLNAHSSMKQSSSELMLACSSNNDTILSQRDVFSDIESRDGDASDSAHDKYIQEARQVFEKIKQIGSQDDYSFDQEVEEHLKSAKKELETTVGVNSESLFLDNSAAEEIVSYRKSLDLDLSGHESSMTDEGIVTEAEPAACALYGDIGQTLTVWKSTGSSQEQGEYLPARNGDSQLLSPNGNLECDTCSEIAGNKAYTQGPLDAPPTPGTIRRRRKFPSLGNGGTDSSSGSNGESGSETYRSLSDPMPNRRYSITEDPAQFSMDSNLLGSLNAKSMISDSTASALSECTGSAASVLSFSSDGIKDYNLVIQNIVSQPGALDKVIDEKGNGKTIKKKSFSDPSRRGELTTPGLEDSNEPSKELEQSILASSSEPILSEQKDELEELEEVEEEVGKLPIEAEENGLEGNQNLNFDPNLVNVLSPRMVRRSFKKRSNRIGSQDVNKEGKEPTEASGKSRQSSKHVRHTSEPAAFIPISPPECKVHGPFSSANSTKHPIKQYPVLIAPLLEDALKPAPTGTGDSNNFGTVDLPRTAPSTPTAVEPKLLKLPKPQEETSIRSKPYVDGAILIQPSSRVTIYFLD